ncbi:sulfatase [Mycolicibacterium litorale]|nr:sulfatase [Mycolicibacterium litorale]
MDDDHELVLVAAYQTLDRAATDFRELEKRIKHGLELRAAALVTKDADGHPHVVEAHNRHGRVAAGLGAGVGILIGLLLPPVELAVLVGGAAGALVGAFAEHELRSGLRHEIGEALDAGTGVVIVLVYPNGRGPVESTLYRAAEVRSVRLDRATINSLDELVAEEMAALSAGRTDTST